jgi:hypothetical protein
MRNIPPRSLDLYKLRGGIPALSVGAGIAMIEACLICFDELKHKSGIEIDVDGSFRGRYSITWSGSVTEDMRRYWKDKDEATEYAAYGLALLLIEELTGYTAIERSNKGTGFDFWLGYYEEADSPTTRYEARLEASGIRRGSNRQIAARIAQKKAQTDISNGIHPAYIAVVELSTPIARVVKK